MHGKRGTLADRTFSHGKVLTLRVIPVFHHDEFKTTSAKTASHAGAGRTHEERCHQPMAMRYGKPYSENLNPQRFLPERMFVSHIRSRKNDLLVEW